MADHKRKKKRGRSKLFRSCFRSFPPDGERPLSYHKNNGRLGKPVGEEFVQDDGRISHNGGLSRFVKAVFFDSVMVKKIRSSSKSSTASDTNESFLSLDHTCKPPDDSTTSGKESTDIDESSSCSNLLSSSSRATTSSSSSSSSSSTNSNPQWLSEPKTSSPTSIADPNLQTSSRSRSQSDSIHLILAKSNSIPQSSSHNNSLSQLELVDTINSVTSYECNSWSIRWCLFLLLSLIVLVIYGRIYAILCTSMWFYLVPRRRVKRVNSVKNLVRFVDTESEQYKKRVIMAGLLDRTRNPIR